MNRLPDFIKRYQEAERKRKRQRALGVFLKLLPVLVIIFIFVVATSVVTAIENGKQSELDDIEAYTKDPGNVVKYNEYKSISANNSSVQTKADSLLRAKEAVLSYPVPDSSLINEIYSLVNAYGINTTISGYTASTGVLAFGVTAHDAATVSPFIKAMYDCGLFANIKYSGYNIAGKDSNYAVSLACALAVTKEVETDE